MGQQSIMLIAPGKQMPPPQLLYGFKGGVSAEVKKLPGGFVPRHKCLGHGNDIHAFAVRRINKRSHALGIC
jgi:hypothetical protein